MLLAPCGRANDGSYHNIMFYFTTENIDKILKNQ
jgi:hypothetical protein